MTMKNVVKFLLIGLIAAAPVSARAALELMTPFADVVVDRLNVGQRYDLARLSRQTFSITNRGTSAVALRIEPVADEPNSLQPGYESIPDTAWISVTPNKLSLAAGETKTVAVALRIPADASLSGRHFQAAIYTRTEGQSLAIGLRSRVRFSVGAERPAVSAARASTAKVEFQPASLPAQDVDSGQVTDLLRDRAAELKILNPGEQPVRVNLRSVYFGEGTLPPGYIGTPNPDFLTLEKRTLELAAHGAELVRLSTNIPAGAAHRGRHYAFLVRADLQDDPSAEPAFARVYVRVREN
jgi:hypothetical protein